MNKLIESVKSNYISSGVDHRVFNTEVDLGQDWFEITPVNDHITAFREPHHDEDVLSFFVRGNSYTALIDTGMGLNSLRKVLDGTVPDIVLLTHTHWDHTGSAAEFPVVAVPDDEFEIHRLMTGWPGPEIKGYEREWFKDGHKPPADYDHLQFLIPGVLPALTLDHRDQINLGGLTITTVATPGHTPGSVCYFIEETGELFTGDTLYNGPIYLHLNESEPLAFPKSLRRLVNIYGRRLTGIFPGHNAVWEPPDLLFSMTDALSAVNDSSQGIHDEDAFGKFVKYAFGRFSFLLPG